MLDAGAALLDVAGNAPRQGDGDEGRALVVDDPEREPWAVVLSAGAAALGAGDWWPRLERSVEASLLGALAAPWTPEPMLDRAPERPSWFPDAGLALLRTPPEDRPEIWCRCDGGPHGFLSIAAHAHADALSLEVRHDGVEILADPGTYCYHGEPTWRQWFRSTAAHNTLEVGGVDQSESGGPFLWTAHARTTTLECRTDAGSRQSWLARHDGYRRLRTPAVHRRAVALDGDRRRLEVVDALEVAEPVPVRLSWHLGPDVRADLDGATARLMWSHGSSAREATLTLPPELRWTAHRGEEESALGWYSPGFGRRVPTTSLIGTGELGPEGRLESTLSFDDATD